MQTFKQLIPFLLLFSLVVSCSSSPVPVPKEEAASAAETTKPKVSLSNIEGEIVSVEKAGDGPYPYEVATLSNGMKIVTLEDHSTPVAAVHLWYHVGSKNERKNRRGFAHMFEHMMFRGTDRLGPKDHFEYIRKTGGDTNAYTAFDQTVYVQEVPSNQVEMVLWLESERMAFLRVDKEGFHTERNVVAEEYRRGAEAPYGNVLTELLPQFFPKHPYAWSPIGNMDELGEAKVEELQEFWETYYIPNNATLVVVGDIEHKKVQDLALRYFGWIPKYPDPPALTIPELPASLPTIEIAAKNGPAPVVGMAFRTVPQGHKDEIPLTLLGQILGGGESSRLHRELVINKKLAVFSLGASFSLEAAGVFGAVAILTPVGSAPDDAYLALQKQIETLRKEGPSEEELLKAKNATLKAEVTAQLTVASKASRLGGAIVLEKNLEGVNDRLDKIRKVTLDDLKRVAKEYLDPTRATEIRVKSSLAESILGGLLGGGSESKPTSESTSLAVANGPTGKPGLTRPENLPEKPPLVNTPPKQNLPSVKEFTLKNGLQIALIEDHEVPLVTYFLGVPYGAYAEPSDTPGTAAMAASMLIRGTENYDYQSLAKEIETYAIGLAPSATLDTTSIVVDSITDEAPRAMKLLAEVVRRPTFPKEHLDLLKTQAQTGKAIEEKDPNYLAERMLRQKLYGTHPYARSADGEAGDLAKLSVSGIQSFWKQFVRPDTSVLYIIGDISEEQAKTLAEEHFGDWKVTGSVADKTLPTPPESEKTQIYLVDRQGEQTQIRVGYRSLTRKDPRYFQVLVLSQIFGGGFNSRLNSAIRVNEGLTYGARGGFSASRFDGSFVASTFSKNETAPETLKLVLDEMKKLKTSPPTEEELSQAKTYLTGSYVLNRESPRAIASDRWLIKYAGLTTDYFDRYLQEIDATTTDNLKTLVNDVMQEDAAVIVVVGPASELKEKLSAIGPVTVISESQ